MLTVDNAGHVIGADQPDFYRAAVLGFVLDKHLPAEPYTGSESPW